MKDAESLGADNSTNAKKITQKKNNLLPQDTRKVE